MARFGFAHPSSREQLTWTIGLDTTPYSGHISIILIQYPELGKKGSEGPTWSIDSDTVGRCKNFKSATPCTHFATNTPSVATTRVGWSQTIAFLRSGALAPWGIEHDLLPILCSPGSSNDHYGECAVQSASKLNIFQPIRSFTWSRCHPFNPHAPDTASLLGWNPSETELETDPGLFG